MASHIGRRKFLATLGGAAAWPVAARGQQAEPLRQIAVLMGSADDTEGLRHLTAFREELQKLGWTDGRNIQTDYRWAAGDADRMRTFAKEVVKQRPDVMLIETTPQVAAFMQESRAIPIVFVNVSDPVGSGFVTSLSRPGGMVTGFISNEPSLGSKWVQVLNDIAPRVRRIAFMFNPNTAPYVEPFLRSAEAAAATYGVELISLQVHDETEMEETVGAFAREPAGGLIVMPEIFTTVHHKRIVALANQYHLPTVHAFRFFATSGGLISYGVDIADQFRRAASYVDRIRRGEKPGDLPVQAQTRLAMVINLKTAKALGLDVSPTLLIRADEVIE
jgi:putative ABC transport system substrate-binding protein